MKNIKATLLGLLSVMVVLVSCEDSTGPTINNDPGTPTITAPASGEAFVLSEETAEDTVMTMTWTAPDYGFAAAPNYRIEMSSNGEGFDNPMELASLTGNSFSITVGDMNGILLGADMPFGEPVSLDIRVLATISDSMAVQASEPITLSFTAYSICQFCPAVYVPGGYQGASGYTNDWSPADAPALNTVDGSDVYEGYVYMANAGNQFKFTPERNWNADYGDNGADGTLEFQGSNIELANSGYYKMNVNMNNNTYSIQNTDWGLIGNATPSGWDADTDMTYDAENKVWTLTTDLTAGEIKFRANDAWDLNYGDAGADGTLEQGADNIAVGAAGNYTITLDLSTLPYTYSVTQN